MAEIQKERSKVLMTGGILIAGALLALPFQHPSNQSNISSNREQTQGQSLLALKGSTDAADIGLAIQPQTDSAMQALSAQSRREIGSQSPSFANQVHFPQNQATKPTSVTKMPVTKMPVKTLPVTSLPTVPDQYEPLLANARYTEMEQSFQQLDRRQAEIANSRQRELRFSRQERAPEMESVPYVIRDGDTLASIAEKFLGDSRFSNQIFAQNRQVIFNPSLLPIGQEINVIRPAARH